jgi:hypothetical protein
MKDGGIANALDNAKPGRYFGPSVLDRTHQLSFGGYVELPSGFQLSVMSHFWSPLSTSLVEPNTNLGPGKSSAPISLETARFKTRSHDYGNL